MYLIRKLFASRFQYSDETPLSSFVFTLAATGTRGKKLKLEI